MKINKKILLFTYGFPTGNTEDTFIKYELSKLINDFEDVEIIPQVNFEIKNKKKIFSKKLNINLDFSRQFTFTNFIFQFLSHTIISKIFYNELKRIIFKKKFFTKLKLSIVELTKSQIAYNWIIKLNKNKYNKDNVIFYSFWSNYLLLAFEKVKKEVNIKTISRVLGSDLNGFIKNDDYVPYFDKKFYSLDKLILLSKVQKNILLKKKLIKKNKITISPLGVYRNNENFVKSKKNEINFLSCNNFIEIKNNLKMIDFIKFVSESCIDKKINYYVIGSGKLYHEIYFNLKKNKNLFNFKIINSVENLPNFMLKNNINFFMNFSSQEGMSFSIMESMSCGIPAIVSDIEANKILVNEKRGYIIKLSNLKKSFLENSKNIINDINFKNQYRLKQINSKKFINNKLLNKNCYTIFYNQINNL